MLQFLKFVLTWWQGCTVGTWVYTVFFGVYVGTDNFGNRYYQKINKSNNFHDGDPRQGQRRWVIYLKTNEASQVPPGWYGWLHYLTDVTPSNYQKHIWERDHRPNPTGTVNAHSPGATYKRPKYIPWDPNG